jgi:hypothetical protein
MELIGGTEACRMLGISHKSGKQPELLKKHGIEIIFMQPQGRGHTTLVRKDQVLKAAEERAARIAEKKANSAAAIEKTKWVPTKEAMAILLEMKERQQAMEVMLAETMAAVVRLREMWETPGAAPQNIPNWLKKQMS